MPEPLGFRHRHRRGIVGMLARWWYERRRRRVRRALDRLD